MKKEKRNYLIYLQDIKISMERILDYTREIDFNQFKNDQKTIDAVIRNFEIIGEASKNVEEDIKEQYKNIPWSEMYFLRNLLSHEYFGVDLKILWDIIKSNLDNDLLSIENVISDLKNK